jgi:hypothetical protein
VLVSPWCCTIVTILFQLSLTNFWSPHWGRTREVITPLTTWTVANYLTQTWHKFILYLTEYLPLHHPSFKCFTYLTHVQGGPPQKNPRFFPISWPKLRISKWNFTVFKAIHIHTTTTTTTTTTATSSFLGPPCMYTHIYNAMNRTVLIKLEVSTRYSCLVLSACHFPL